MRIRVKGEKKIRKRRSQDGPSSPQLVLTSFGNWTAANIGVKPKRKPNQSLLT